MKLLLVDDDAFLRDMYAVKFEAAGHSVTVADSGSRALLELEKTKDYDAVILDMVMPGMSGTELLAEISALEKVPKCLVVLSNQGQSADIDEATAAGATGYIVKAKHIPSEVVAQIESMCA